ncbi:MAG TPA: YihY/virulence factor BrkB family protein [Burkholderiaceae bacterium]|nr:YihY/virulence factor BrkB family protein [Burkholderiaceae bacterium]
MSSPSHVSQSRPLRAAHSAGLVARIRAGLVPFMRWGDDHCSSWSASVAFYAAFSLAPTLVVVIGVASMLLGPEAVQGRLYAQIQGLVGADAAIAIQAMVANAWKSGDRGWTTVISLGAIAVGASATFAELNSALNVIFAVPMAKQARGLSGLVRVRLVSFGLVVGIGFLLVVLLVLDAALGAVTEWLWRADDTSKSIASAVRVLVTLSGLVMAFTLLLRALPDITIRWKDALRGGISAALLFTAGRGLFAWYLESMGTANTLGAAGSLAVILMWLYYSTAVFLLGAQFAVPAGTREPAS